MCIAAECDLVRHLAEASLVYVFLFLIIVQSLFLELTLTIVNTFFFFLAVCIYGGACFHAASTMTGASVKGTGFACQSLRPSQHCSPTAPWPSDWAWFGMRPISHSVLLCLYPFFCCFSPDCFFLLPDRLQRDHLPGPRRLEHAPGLDERGRVRQRARRGNHRLQPARKLPVQRGDQRRGVRWIVQRRRHAGRFG